MGSSRDDGLGCDHFHGKQEVFSRTVKHQYEHMHHYLSVLTLLLREYLYLLICTDCSSYSGDFISRQ